MHGIQSTNRVASSYFSVVACSVSLLLLPWNLAYIKVPSFCIVMVLIIYVLTVFSIDTNVALTVADANDNPPTFGQDAYTTTVPESLSVGGLVLQVS